MAIDPIAFLPTTAVKERGAGSRKGLGGLGFSAFDALLETASETKGTASSMKAQQAALELLRMEMMQSSLSLAGDGDESTAPSGLKALETLICGAAGNRLPKREPGAVAAASGEVAAAPPAVADSGSEDITSTAERFLGTRYRFGGEGADGIDCSSLVQQVFREHQISLPRTAREQIHAGSDVAAGDLKKGDLVFFHTYASYPSHVGIYLGDGKMIHASSAKGEVTVSDMNSNYYRSRFIGARRIA